MLAAARLNVGEKRTIIVNIAGNRIEAVGRYAHGSLQRIRGAAAPALSPEDLAALDELLDVNSPHSILQRDDLAVRTERTIWAARRT